MTSYMVKYKYLEEFADVQTSNIGLTLNNVPETVKHLLDQRLLAENFAGLSQVF